MPIDNAGGDDIQGQFRSPRAQIADPTGGRRPVGLQGFVGFVQVEDRIVRVLGQQRVIGSGLMGHRKRLALQGQGQRLRIAHRPALELLEAVHPARRDFQDVLLVFPVVQRQWLARWLFVPDLMRLAAARQHEDAKTQECLCVAHSHVVTLRLVLFSGSWQPPWPGRQPCQNPLPLL
ncbi:hypothetical protein D3C87_1508860 [compost metagenome]